MNYLDENEISSKSHLIAGLLCICLGYIGVHRFYVGKYLSGIIYVAITLLIVPMFTINILLGFFLIGIMILLVGVDFSMIYYYLFTDAKGKTVFPEKAYSEEKKEPLLPLVLFGMITIALLIISGFNNSFFGISMISLFVTAIFFIKELKYLLKK